MDVFLALIMETVTILITSNHQQVKVDNFGIYETFIIVKNVQKSLNLSREFHLYLKQEVYMTTLKLEATTHHRL